MPRTLLRTRFVEACKATVRHNAYQAGLDVRRDPYVARLARMLERLGVTSVLDVGANLGQFASDLRCVGYRGRIVSCEPLSEEFSLLARRAKGDPRWDTVHTAVGAVPGRAIMHVSQNSYSSSLRQVTKAHLDAAPRSRVVGEVEVPLTTVDALVAEHSINGETTLLKIDTQGFESEVLEGATASLSQVAGVQLEMSFVSLYQGQRLMPQLHDVLSGRGFELFNLEPGLSDGSGRLLQMDALYARSALLS